MSDMSYWDYFDDLDYLEMLDGELPFGYSESPPSVPSAASSSEYDADGMSDANSDNEAVEIGSCSKFHSNLSDFRYNKKHCDVRIRVQDQTFECHRVVLSAASVYFDTMFGGNFKESRSEEITLHQIDAVAFNIILETVYNKCEPVIDASNVYNLLQTSEFLNFNQVKRRCVDFILRNMKSVDAVKIFCLAHALNLTKLIKSLMPYLLRNFTNTIKSSTFLGIPYHTLISLLGEYRLSSSRTRFENCLLDAIVRWVNSSKGRKNYFRELADMVDFSRVTISYVEFMLVEYKIDCEIFEDLNGNSEVLKNEFSLKKAVVDGFMLNGDELADRCDGMPLPYKDPVLSKLSSTFHIYVKTKKHFNVFSLDNYKDESDWYLACKIPRSNLNPTKLVALHEPSYLYCLKYSSEMTNILFQAYSSISMSSPKKLSFPFFVPDYYRSSFQLCGKDNCIYLCGNQMSSFIGFLKPQIESQTLEFNDFSHNIYRYICDVDKWILVPRHIPINRPQPCLLTDDKLVYLIGGNFIGALVVQAYDDRVSRWTELPNPTDDYPDVLSLPVRHKTCVANGKIYMWTDSTLDVFDPVAGRWRKLERFEGLSPYDFSMYSYNNTLWVFDADNEFCYTFNCLTEEWHKLNCTSIFPSKYFKWIMNAITFKTLEI